MIEISYQVLKKSQRRGLSTKNDIAKLFFLAIIRATLAVLPDPNMVFHPSTMPLINPCISDKF